MHWGVLLIGVLIGVFLAPWVKKTVGIGPG
jgi:hypothetical protein